MKPTSESPRARLLRRLGGPGKTGTPIGASDIVWNAETAKVAGERDWRLDLQRIDELLILDAARGAPLTETIGFVVVLGRNQLDAVRPSNISSQIFDPAKKASLLKGRQRIMGGRLRIPTQRDSDLLERWHHAMLALMGAEELQKFGLTLSKTHHGNTRGGAL